jgi:hypothetical protein
LNPRFYRRESTTSNIMPWTPWSASSGKDGDGKRQPISWTDSLNATNWSHYTDPRTVIPTVLLTTSILAAVHLYRSYLRRIPEAASVAPHFFRKRTLFGTVTRVGDGDNFHLYHTPGGRLAGWGWLPWRKIPEKKGGLKNRTVWVLVCFYLFSIADELFSSDCYPNSRH